MILLEKLTADIQTEICGIDYTAHKAEIIGEQILAFSIIMTPEE